MQGERTSRVVCGAMCVCADMHAQRRLCARCAAHPCRTGSLAVSRPCTPGRPPQAPACACVRVRVRASHVPLDIRACARSCATSAWRVCVGWSACMYVHPRMPRHAGVHAWRRARWRAPSSLGGASAGALGTAACHGPGTVHALCSYLVQQQPVSAAVLVQARGRAQASGPSAQDEHVDLEASSDGCVQSSAADGCRWGLGGLAPVQRAPGTTFSMGAMATDVGAPLPWVAGTPPGAGCCCLECVWRERGRGRHGVTFTARTSTILFSSSQNCQLGLININT